MMHSVANLLPADCPAKYDRMRQMGQGLRGSVGSLLANPQEERRCAPALAHEQQEWRTAGEAADEGTKAAAGCGQHASNCDPATYWEGVSGLDLNLPAWSSSPDEERAGVLARGDEQGARGCSVPGIYAQDWERHQALRSGLPWDLNMELGQGNSPGLAAPLGPLSAAPLAALLVAPTAQTTAVHSWEEPRAREAARASAAGLAGAAAARPPAAATRTQQQIVAAAHAAASAGCIGRRSAECSGGESRSPLLLRQHQVRPGLVEPCKVGKCFPDQNMDCVVPSARELEHGGHEASLQPSRHSKFLPDLNMEGHDDCKAFVALAPAGVAAGSGSAAAYSADIAAVIKGHELCDDACMRQEGEALTRLDLSSRLSCVLSNIKQRKKQTCGLAVEREGAWETGAGTPVRIVIDAEEEEDEGMQGVPRTGGTVAADVEGLPAWQGNQVEPETSPEHEPSGMRLAGHASMVVVSSPIACGSVLSPGPRPILQRAGGKMGSISTSVKSGGLGSRGSGSLPTLEGAGDSGRLSDSMADAFPGIETRSQQAVREGEELGKVSPSEYEDDGFAVMLQMLWAGHGGPEGKPFALPLLPRTLCPTSDMRKAQGHAGLGGQREDLQIATMGGSLQPLAEVAEEYRVPSGGGGQLSPPKHEGKPAERGEEEGGGKLGGEEEFPWEDSHEEKGKASCKTMLLTFANQGKMAKRKLPLPPAIAATAASILGFPISPDQVSKDPVSCSTATKDSSSPLTPMLEPQRRWHESFSAGHTVTATVLPPMQQQHHQQQQQGDDLVSNSSGAPTALLTRLKALLFPLPLRSAQVTNCTTSSQLPASETCGMKRARKWGLKDVECLSPIGDDPCTLDFELDADDSYAAGSAFVACAAGSRLMVGSGSSGGMARADAVIGSSVCSRMPTFRELSKHGLRALVSDYAFSLASGDKSKSMWLETELRTMSSAHGRAFERLGLHLVDALSARMTRGMSDVENMFIVPSQFSKAVVRSLQYYSSTSPLLPFAFTAAHTMLFNAIAGRRRAHIICAGATAASQLQPLLRSLATLNSQRDRGRMQVVQANTFASRRAEGIQHLGEEGVETRWDRQCNGVEVAGPGQQEGKYEEGFGGRREQGRGKEGGCGLQSLRVTIVGQALRETREKSKKLAQLLRRKAEQEAAHLRRIVREAGIPCFEHQCLILESGGLDQLSLIEGRRRSIPEQCPPEGQREMEVDEEEVLALCCGFTLSDLPHESVHGLSPRDTILQWTAALQPDVMAVMDSDFDATSPFFLARLHSCYDFYSDVFESHDEIAPRDMSGEIRTAEAAFFGTAIVNAIAAEGMHRMSRAMPHEKWSEQFRLVGMRPIAVTSVLQSKLLELLQAYPPGFGMVVEGDAVKLTWKGRSLLFASSWTVPRG